MNSDKSLTIVLPIKDRISFTFRWMAYADKISFPFKVLIADGGKDERAPAILTKPTNFPNVNYEYIRYPYDQTYSEYYTKTADAISRVDTPFVAVVDDACFYVVDGLTRSVEFLCSHPDYSACGGNIGAFSIGPFEKPGPPIRAYGQEIRFFSNMYCLRHIADETAATRVWNHFLHYPPTYYDVHRAEQLRACFKVLKDLNLRDIFLAELLTSFLTVCAGKIRKESYLYMLRQTGHRNSCAGEHTKKWGDYFDRMLLESWSGDFTKFVHTIVSAISNQDGISVDDARQQVKKGYRMHIAPYIIELLSTQNRKPNRGIVGGMKSLARKLKYDGVPRRLLERLHSAVCAIRNDRPNRSRPIPICKSSEFYEDIKPIHEILTSQQPKRRFNLGWPATNRAAVSL